MRSLTGPRGQKKKKNHAENASGKMAALVCAVLCLFCFAKGRCRLLELNSDPWPMVKRFSFKSFPWAVKLAVEAFSWQDGFPRRSSVSTSCGVSPFRLSCFTGTKTMNHKKGVKNWNVLFGFQVPCTQTTQNRKPCLKRTLRPPDAVWAVLCKYLFIVLTLLRQGR